MKHVISIGFDVYACSITAVAFDSFSQAARLLPKDLLDELGITRLRADEVTLKLGLLDDRHR